MVIVEQIASVASGEIGYGELMEWFAPRILRSG